METTELLTPKEPRQKSRLTKFWRQEIERSPILTAVREYECVHVLPWEGLQIGDIKLEYANLEKNRYDHMIPDIAKHELGEFSKNYRKIDPRKLEKWEGESWERQVRLSRIEQVDPHFPQAQEKHKVTLHLTPIKYLYYVGIQAQLWDPQYKKLRESAFRNALESFHNEESLALPSHFSIHMAVISKEGRAILRERPKHTELYPEAWEAGVGEFMHGPEYQADFPHFDKKGTPNLGLYLKHAVKEELRYAKARPKDFSLYGFAVEYRTLAPKLIVVYQSDATEETLIEGGLLAADKSRNVKSIELSVKGIIGALSDDVEYPKWGPTSKLALVLALTKDMSHKKKQQAIKQIKANREKFKISIGKFRDQGSSMDLGRKPKPSKAVLRNQLDECGTRARVYRQYYERQGYARSTIYRWCEEYELDWEEAREKWQSHTLRKG